MSSLAGGAPGAAPLIIDALYARHFGRLVTLATAWLGDRDAAEDVAQAALVAAWEATRRGVAIVRPDAWLTRAARNLAVDHLRRRARQRRLGGPTASAGAPLCDPAEAVERRERLDGVLAAILALPARWRRVVLDANVLVQAPIRDTLLRAAEEELLAVCWGPTILDEVARTLRAECVNRFETGLRGSRRSG
jgi:RNA polymerase sigma factor (sigma-70 family)